MTETTNAGEKKNSNWIFKIIILIVIGSALWWGWKYFNQIKNGDQSQVASTTITNQINQAEVEKITKELMTAVGKLIVLPDEEPTLATILDAKKLIAEQTFYAGSEDGDQLLIFPKAQKAIIYSPTKNILVNVGPVYFNNSTNTPATTN